jgi:hypothetical protein
VHAQSPEFRPAIDTACATALQCTAQTWRALRAALCGSRRYAAAAYVVTYYPPAPRVVATTASGVRLTDMPESAMVRSFVRPCRGFGVGVGISVGFSRQARYGTMHRCQHAVVLCMEEVACHSVARSMLHATCRMVYAACCMHHAACCMHHAACVWRARGMARLGVRREPIAPSFHVASRRLPPCVGPAEHSPLVVPHLQVIRAAAAPGILHAPLPTAAPGPHSAPGTETPVPIPTFGPGPSPQPPRGRAARP